MSGQTIVLVQMANPNAQYSLFKSENLSDLSEYSSVSQQRKIVWYPESSVKVKAVPTLQLKTIDSIKTEQVESPVDLRQATEDQSNSVLNASEKYQRIKQQNCDASKRNRIRKKSLSNSDSGSDSKMELSRHLRRPRMDLSQLDDAAKYKRIRELNNLASKRLREKKRKLMQDAHNELMQLSMHNSKLKLKLGNLQAIKDELRSLLLKNSN